LTTKTTDNKGLSTTSASVKFSVTSSSGNKAPVVTLKSPSNYSTFKSPASIYMLASAYDVDGTISKVEFYNGTKLLHTEYNGTYSYSWNNVPSGSYTITAKATDDKGVSTTSASIRISVTSARPSNNNQPLAAADSLQTVNFV